MVYLGLEGQSSTCISVCKQAIVAPRRRSRTTGGFCRAWRSPRTVPETGTTWTWAGDPQGTRPTWLATRVRTAGRCLDSGA